MYNRAEVLDGILYALDAHEFVFAWLMGLADALGPITPKANAEGPLRPGPETANSGAVAEKANPTDPDTPQSPPPKLPPEKSVLFDAITCLDAQLTTLHAALPGSPRFSSSSGHSDLRVMSALTARRSDFQASLNQSHCQGQNGGIAAAAVNTGMTTTTAGDNTGGGGDATTVGWTTGDDRALEEAVGRARTGLLFVGSRRRPRNVIGS